MLPLIAADSVQQTCPPGNPASYAFPTGLVDPGWGLPVVFTSALEGAGPSFDTIDNGLRTEDVNGDGLVDLLWAYWNQLPPAAGGSFYVQCVYLNTGSGWSLVNGSTSLFVDVGGVRALIANVSVGEFATSMARELGVAAGAVEVRSRDGKVRYWQQARLDRLATTCEGFSVYVNGVIEADYHC